MSVEAIDQLLTAWEERLVRVDENLLALEADPTYQILSGATGHRATLDGVTASRVRPALDALSQLFEHRERLTDILDRAKAVRESISAITFWNNEEKLQEVQDLLHGPSIKMGTLPTPLAKRNLLDPAAQDVAVVPEELLLAMARAYEVARDAVAEVQRAWETLEPALEAHARALSETRARATSLGVIGSMESEIVALERELGAARTCVARDPLGASSGVNSSLAPRVETLCARVDALARTRDHAMSALAEAHAMRARLAEAQEHARHARVEGPRDFIEATTLPRGVDDGAIEALAPWLEKIEDAARAGRWTAVDVGLERWREAAAAYLRKERDVVGALDALRARRAELAGRLSARRAQASAIAARAGAIDPSAEAIAQRAETALRARPTSLADASALVEQYEAAAAHARAHTRE